jgi:polyferredoxin
MALRIGGIRTAAQHLSFAALIYGGRIGVNLGSAVPCFACPFVSGCGGQCYLMGLQGFIGFGMSVGALQGALFFRALGWLALFILLAALFGKLWCGWVCPFGLVQDWLTALRKRLGIRERIITGGVKKKLAPLKYLLLIYMISLPPLVTLGLLHQDFYLPFCNICPGKSLLPLFTGNVQYLALNFNSGVTLGYSIALLVITGIMLIGMFFKERFFCLFCPMLALIHLLKPLTALRLVKKPQACTGCGTCTAACPMGIDIPYKERVRRDIQSELCLDCLRCTESCPAPKALSLTFFKLRLFSSSRRYAAGGKP